MAQWIKNLLLGVLIGFIFLCQLKILKAENISRETGSIRGRSQTAQGRGKREGGGGCKGLWGRSSSPNLGLVSLNKDSEVDRLTTLGQTVQIPVLNLSNRSASRGAYWREEEEARPRLAAWLLSQIRKVRKKPEVCDLHPLFVSPP